MSQENWGFDDIEWEDDDQEEPENLDEPDGHIDFLLINLGEKAIKNVLDCYHLWKELENIAEDFPGYLPVFVINNGSGKA